MPGVSGCWNGDGYKRRMAHTCLYPSPWLVCRSLGAHWRPTVSIRVSTVW